MKKLILSLALLLCASAARAMPYLDIKEVHTPKNLTVWFVQDKNIPVMTLKFSLQGGSQLDEDGKEGTSELLSTLFDEGAGTRDSEAFQNDMDAYGIKIGFSATRDRFYGSLKTITQNQEIADELFDDALNKPHFSEEAIARMKAALMSSLRFQMMDPDWMANRKMFDTVFAGQDYARPVEGTTDTLPTIMRDDLQKEKNELFCRERLKIAVVGDLDEQKVIEIADRFFGDWPTCPTPVDEKPAEIENAGKEVYVPWKGAQSVVIMAQPGLNRQDKDWWAARILDFNLGGGEFSSRLMEEVRVKRGLTYGISTNIVPLERAPLWLVQAGVDPAKSGEAVSVIKKIWADVAVYGLTDDEIKQAQDFIIGSLPLALTSTDTIAGILLQLQQDDLPKNTLDTRAAEIKAVTKADIKRVAKKRLKSKALTTVVVGPVEEHTTTTTTTTTEEP